MDRVSYDTFPRPEIALFEDGRQIARIEFSASDVAVARFDRDRVLALLTTPAPEPAAAPAVGEEQRKREALLDRIYHYEMWARDSWKDLAVAGVLHDAAAALSTPAPAAGLVTAEEVPLLNMVRHMAGERSREPGDGWDQAAAILRRITDHAALAARQEGGA